MAKGREPKTVSADAPPVEADVPLHQIDAAPAFAVRLGPDLDAVADWSEKMRDGERFDPADVFRYGTYHALGDGGHRYLAAQGAGRPALLCRIHLCKSRQEAEDRAYDFAFGSNVRHGVRRRPDDKRAAVKAALTKKKYAEASDGEIAELCKVSKPLVRSVRERLTAEGTLAGPAAAGPDRYKESDSIYAQRMKGAKLTVSDDDDPPADDSDPDGVTHADDAGTVSADDLPWRERPVGCCGATPVVLAELTGRHGLTTLGGLADRLAANETFGLIPHVLKDLIENLQVASGWTWPPEEPDPEPNAGAVGADEPKPVAAVLDERGRPVPERLAAVFAERGRYRKAAQLFGAFKKQVRAEFAGSPDCCVDWSTVDVDLENAAKSVAVAMPYCVCPACDGGGTTGKGDCGVCSRRGWLSRLRYQQLTPDQKAIADSHAA